jgi:hypothetical protein
LRFVINNNAAKNIPIITDTSGSDMLDSVEYAKYMFSMEKLSGNPDELDNAIDEKNPELTTPKKPTSDPIVLCTRMCCIFSLPKSPTNASRSNPTPNQSAPTAITFATGKVQDTTDDDVAPPTPFLYLPLETELLLFASGSVGGAEFVEIMPESNVMDCADGISTRKASVTLMALEATAASQARRSVYTTNAWLGFTIQNKIALTKQAAFIKLYCLSMPTRSLLPRGIPYSPFCQIRDAARFAHC